MTVPNLKPSKLAPYVSFGVLRYVGSDSSRSLVEIEKQLRKGALRRRKTGDPELVASGLPSSWVQRVASGHDATIRIRGFSYRYTKAPGWSIDVSEPLDVVHGLVLLIARDDLVAIHCPADRVDSLQKWLDRSPRPPYERIAPVVLESSLLVGESKGLWLRGTHRRQRTKADAKNLSGLELRDAIDPFDDGSFALSSGRSAVNEDDTRLSATTGTIGTTLARSWIWNRGSESLSQFVAVVLELLDAVAQGSQSGIAESQFPDLAERVEDLNDLAQAFDGFFLDADEVRQLPGFDEETAQRAEALEGTLIEVQGHSDRRVTLIVGDNGAECGRLDLRPKLENGSVSFTVGISGTPSDPARFAEIRDLVGSGDLLSVYYDSGHSIVLGTVSRPRVSHAVFPQWQFQDFAGFNVAKEKPAGSTAQEIHNAIAMHGDDSLFAWVLRTYSHGHLTCDDGANEVADFVHLADDGLLSLVHVKAAGTKSLSRRCSAGAFEVVVSQATKNARYLVTERLVPQLERSTITPATWLAGKRVADRQAMLAGIRARGASDPTRVVIVQPHHCAARHNAARGGGAGQDQNRLHLIETMLNSARGSIVGLGSELDVIGAE